METTTRTDNLCTAENPAEHRQTTIDAAAVEQMDQSRQETMKALLQEKDDQE